MLGDITTMQRVDLTAWCTLHALSRPFPIATGTDAGRPAGACEWQSLPPLPRRRTPTPSDKLIHMTTPPLGDLCFLINASKQRGRLRGARRGCRSLPSLPRRPWLCGSPSL